MAPEHLKKFQFTSESGRLARISQPAAPRTTHRLLEVVRDGRRPCRPKACVKRKACPYGDREGEAVPDRCLALEAHLRAFTRSLQREVRGPIRAHLLSVIARREELITLASWWLSETAPFGPVDGKVVPAPVVATYQQLLNAQARDLQALGARRDFERPDPSRVFGEALAAAVDVTPGKDDDRG